MQSELDKHFQNMIEYYNLIRIKKIDNTFIMSRIEVNLVEWMYNVRGYYDRGKLDTLLTWT